MAKAIPESQLLLPRDPSNDLNTDAWHEFELSDVRVHLPNDADSIVSLLDAATFYPVTLTGQLKAPTGDSAGRLISPLSAKHTNVILEDVPMFSYGQRVDHSVAIWAAGKAGWFAITPGRDYRKIYAEMVDAVEVFYFIADTYKKPRRAGKGRNAPVLPEFTPEEIFEQYTLEEMDGDADAGADDGAEVIYKHKEFLMSQMMIGKEGLVWNKNPLYRHLLKRFPDTHRELKRKITGVGLAKDQDAHSTRDSIAAGPAASAVQKKPARAPKKRDIEVISIASSSEARSTTAKQPALDKTSMPAPPRKPVRKALAPRRTRRTSKAEPPEQPVTATTKPTITTPSKDSDSEDEVSVRPRSSLRPKGSKATKSAKRTGTKALQPDADEDEDALSGHSSPIVIAGKRKLSDSPAETRRPSKRRESQPPADEGIDIPDSPSSPDASEILAGAPQHSHASDPTQENTWTCVLDGCTHKVYAASTGEAQRFIREHYALHAYDDDVRVQLVKRLRAPSLPVERLMERVRVVARGEGFPSSRVGGMGGMGVGVGVVRRY